MAIETGDVLRVAARLLWFGASDIVNVFWVQVLDDAAETLDNIITSVKTHLEAIYIAHNNVVPDDTDYADISVANWSKGEAYGASGWPTLTIGGNNNDPYAPAVSAFVYFPTYVPNVTGRKWYGPLTEPDINAGILTGATITLLEAGVVAFLGIATNPTYGVQTQFRIPHFIEGGVELETPQFIIPVSGNIDSVAGYQRRRRPGAGS